MIFNKKNKSPDSERTRKHQTSQRVFSYYTANRNQIDNFERQSSVELSSLQSRKNRSLRNTVFIVLVFLAVITMAVYLSVLDTKAHVQVIGTIYRSEASYQLMVSRTLSSSFKNRTKFLLDTKHIENLSLQNIPEALSVKAGSDLLGHKPDIKIYTADPLAIFAQNNNSHKYIISTHGKILISLDETSYDYINLPVISNNTGLDATVGMQFLRPNEAREIASLVGQLNKDSSKFTLAIDRQPHQIDLYESGRGYYVKFLLDENTILNQYGAMRAVQNKLNLTGAKPNEYIDVRLSDKIYYK